MPATGGPMQQITHMQAYSASPAWSPDGQEIAFGSRHNDALKVWKVTISGGQPQPFNNANLSSRLLLTWFPGKDILYQGLDLRNFYKLNPTTEKETPLVQDESIGWMFSAPRYSFDGRNVAVHRGMQFEPAKSGIMQISLQDSSQKLLVKGWPTPIVWSNDSKWIYVHSIDKSLNKVLKVPANGGEIETVFTLPVDEIDGLTMTPDGKHLVYAAVETKSDIWYMEHFEPEGELEKPFELIDSTALKQLTFLENANNLSREGKYAEAEKSYNEGLKLNPDHAGLRHDLGRALNNQKNYTEAEKVFREGISRDSNYPRFYDGLGWSLFWQRKYAAAEEIFRKGLELNPKNRALLNGMRQAALANKNYEMAKRYTEQYLALQGRPSTRRNFLYRLGSIEILMKDYINAEKHYRQAYAIDTTHSEAIRGMGYLFAEQKDWVEADKYARQALALDSSFANYNLAGMVLIFGNIDLDRGIAFAEKALSPKPETWQLRIETYPYTALPEHTLGLAYLKKGEFSKAVQYLEQAATFAPERQAIQEELKQAKQKLNEMSNR